jgi:hypothetical protein
LSCARQGMMEFSDGHAWAVLDPGIMLTFFRPDMVSQSVTWFLWDFRQFGSTDH